MQNREADQGDERGAIGQRYMDARQTARYLGRAVRAVFFDRVLRFASDREFQWKPCFHYTHWLTIRSLLVPEPEIGRRAW